MQGSFIVAFYTLLIGGVVGLALPSLGLGDKRREEGRKQPRKRNAAQR